MELVIEKLLRDPAGEFRLDVQLQSDARRIVFFGPSGSGKSVTLRLIAGLLTPDRGRIRLNGRVLYDHTQGLDLAARQRRIGFLFQDYALFPHLTLRDNIAFGLRRLFTRLDGETSQRIDELMASFGLAQLADRRPGQLSGGQRQRAALARALAPRPEILLLDEPFSALDQPLRQLLREEVARLLDISNPPLILVTHDPAEALFFGEAIAIFCRGRITTVLATADLQRDSDPVARLSSFFDSNGR